MLRVKKMDINEVIPLLENKKTSNFSWILNCLKKNELVNEGYYFGIYDDNVLVGIAEFLNKNNENFNTKNVFQLRTFSVKEQYQRKGVGANLLMHAEAFLKETKSALIWCNVKNELVSFCKKNGYHIKDEVFGDYSLEEQRVMYKLL